MTLRKTFKDLDSSNSGRLDLFQKNFNYAEVLKAAREQTDSIVLRIADHQVDTSEFQSFFRTLRAHLVFNWQIQSSVFFLTTNLLTDVSEISVEKYGALHAMIASQLWGEGGETDSSGKVQVLDRFGKQLGDKFTNGKDFAVGEQLKTFAAALNWLALRTVFYTFAAEENRMEVVLHPIRHAFLANQVQKLYNLPSSTYRILTSLLRDGITGTVQEIMQVSDPILSEMNLPMWSGYLATTTKDPAESLTECQHLRERKAS